MMTDQEPTRRRWYQFRLRTLLIVMTFVVMTLFALPFAWVASELAQRRKEKEVVAWIVEKGGGAESTHGALPEWFGKTVYSVRFSGRPVIDLSPLADLKSLAMLYLDDTQVSDLSPLAGMKDLMHLGLNDTQVSDLSPLAEMDNLEMLTLDDTQVSDLSPLAGLKNLHLVSVPGTKVTDLSPLAGLENLEILSLYDTGVTDLSPLIGLKNLKHLNLYKMQMSREQVEMLRQALPNCEIKE